MERRGLIREILVIIVTVAVSVPLGFAYGWILFVLYHYQHVRRQEVLNLLTTAAEKNVPLAPALRAYVNDRPRGHGRAVAFLVLGVLVALAILLKEYWLAITASFLFPGVLMLANGRLDFDRKVKRLAKLLENGSSLSEALRRTPALAEPETILGAAVGESTGDLAGCMRKVSLRPLTPVWLEVLPRLAYPLFILLTLLLIEWFQLVFIVPKFEKIFLDFKIRLPEATEFFIVAGRHFYKYFPWLLAGLFALVVLGLALGTRACWHLPVVGRYYRMFLQSRFLSMLGLLLEVGKSLPVALRILVDSRFFSGVAERRLKMLSHDIEQGEPLADTMCRHGLLPAAMAPLVHAAERARHLPWALAELGDTLARRVVQRTQRLAMTIFPLAVFAVALLVGFIAYAMFVPLLQLIAGLGG